MPKELKRVKNWKYSDLSHCIPRMLLTLLPFPFLNYLIHFVGWMQEGRKCIFVVLQKMPFCAQISFVFFFLTSCFFHKYANTLSWDPHCRSKCVILPDLLISVKNSISFKMSLTTFLHWHDDFVGLYLLTFLAAHMVGMAILTQIHKTFYTF